MIENGGNRSKTIEIDRKRLKTVQNGRNRPKSVENGRNRSKSLWVVPVVIDLEVVVMGRLNVRAIPTFVSTSWRHPWDLVLKVILRRASVMANTTPLVTTVTKPTINPAEANSAPRFNIQEFCEEHYEDILPIIMEKVRHDRRKDVHTRLDFGEGPRERVREDSYSNARARASELGRVKENQENDKIGSKSDKNGKRGEAGKSLK
nr:hypothetical protein [Tanacetum cinerariifolium]